MTQSVLQQDSRLEEARRLLDALEVELRTADDEAAAAGMAPDARIQLSGPPPELARAQVSKMADCSGAGRHANCMTIANGLQLKRLTLLLLE